MSGAIGTTTRFTLARDVRWRLVDGEVVVVVQQRGEVLGLNETASLAFERAAAGASFGDIVTSLLEELDVDERALTEDLRLFFAGLASDGLVTVATIDAPGGAP